MRRAREGSDGLGRDQMGWGGIRGLGRDEEGWKDIRGH